MRKGTNDILFSLAIIAFLIFINLFLKPELFEFYYYGFAIAIVSAVYFFKGIINVLKSKRNESN